MRKPRATLVVKLNILRSEIEKVAESIKLKLISRGGTWRVYVLPDGDVVLERIDQPAKLEKPDHWLIGTYTKAVKVEELEDDLTARYHELRRRAA